MVVFELVDLGVWIVWTGGGMLGLDGRRRLLMWIPSGMWWVGAGLVDRGEVPLEVCRGGDGGSSGGSGRGVLLVGIVPPGRRWILTWWTGWICDWVVLLWRG